MVTWMVVKIEGSKYLIWISRPYVIILLYFDQLVEITGYVSVKY